MKSPLVLGLAAGVAGLVKDADPHGIKLDLTTTTTCAKGMYASEDGSECLYCPAGKRTEAAGTSSSADCVDCAAGTYCPADNRYTYPCPAGSYCPGYGQYARIFTTPPGTYAPTGSEQPVLCEAGKVTAAAGAPSEDDCEPCPPGKYCAGVDRYVRETPQGTYTIGGNAEPLLCDKGYITNFAGATSEDDCKPCEAGTYCAGVDREVRDCPANTFSNAGSWDCTPCPSGQTSLAGSASCSTSA